MPEASYTLCVLTDMVKTAKRQQNISFFLKMPKHTQEKILAVLPSFLEWHAATAAG